jgi:exodeoxyribonuclease VII small subunit
VTKELTFEELYGQLEEKARKLEQGNLPLAEALKLYDEGAALVHRLREILDAAELRVETIQSRLSEDEAQLREVEAGYDEDEE